MPSAAHALRAVVWTVAGLALAAGCTGGSSSDGSRPSATATRTSPTPAATSAAPFPGAASSTYVAFGDSYTAGPGITPSQQDVGLCQRSARNWPTVLADTLDLQVRDLSCSGATTSDLSTTLASGTLPTLTGLVTVGVGGNDGGLFLSLIQACATGAQQCGAYVDDRAPAILDRTTADVSVFLRRVHQIAPRARVVLVGYPRIMPTSGTCAAVGISADAASSVVKAETALDEALASAAAQADVDYTSLRAPSEGHDACAGGQAWTNGVSPTSGDGIVFHPNARGMAAVANVVAADVRQRPGG